LVLVAVLVGVAALRLTAQQEALPASAKFVLVQSEFQTQSNNTRLTERTMFKLDTTTGKVWRFVSTVRSGNLEAYWDPIDELQPKR